MATSGTSYSRPYNRGVSLCLPCSLVLNIIISKRLLTQKDETRGVILRGDVTPRYPFQ